MSFNPHQWYLMAADKIVDFSFDMKVDDVNFKQFLVQRASDSVQAEFSTLEIDNGTYTTWLGGSTGSILEWRDSIGKKVIKKYSTFEVPKLTTGYVDDDSSGAGLISDPIYFADFETSDYCVSIVLGNELDGANQRSNIKICTSNAVTTVMIFPNSGFHAGFINIATTKINSNAADFTYTKIKAGFKILVFHINNKQVVNAYFDGVVMTANATPEAQEANSYFLANRILLGVRELGGAGKITPYKHFGIKFNTDPIALSNELNLKYSIY